MLDRVKRTEVLYTHVTGPFMSDAASQSTLTVPSGPLRYRKEGTGAAVNDMTCIDMK